jgi:hypothetical protein
MSPFGMNRTYKPHLRLSALRGKKGHRVAVSSRGSFGLSGHEPGSTRRPLFLPMTDNNRMATSAALRVKLACLVHTALPREPPRRRRQCRRDEAGQAPRGVRDGHQRNVTDDPFAD